MIGVISILMLLAAPQPPAGEEGIAPFVGENTVIAVHVDLARLEQMLNPTSPMAQLLTEDDRALAGTLLESSSQWIAAMRAAGACELALLYDPTLMPGGKNPISPPEVVVPLRPGADAKAIGALLCGGGPIPPIYPFPTCAEVKGAVFAGTPEGLERARLAHPVRPELGEALAIPSDAAVRLVIMPGSDQRKIVEEMLPSLPPDLGGAPITSLTQGLKWVLMSLEAGTKPGLHVVAQGADAASAVEFQRVMVRARQLVVSRMNGMKENSSTSSNAKRLLSLSPIVKELEPKVEGERVTLDLDLSRQSDLIRVPLEMARAERGRMQSVNNLKQLGLAMHNYLSSSENGTFPGAYSADASGKPLLSWRVHILPYIEQQALYKQFHLNEPWDSPHNKPLAAEMPEVFRNPAYGARLSSRGMTTYVVPRGEQTAFTGATGLKIKEFTDGTSNTVLVIDAPLDRAVPWTSPQDWEAGKESAPAILAGPSGDGTWTLFADGSARYFRPTIDANLFRALITPAGGEVIDYSKL